MRAVNLHCDGACLDNGRSYAIGGYGIVVEEKGQVITTRFGKLRDGVQTNNRAELEAMLQVLNYIFEEGNSSTQYTIYSDSTTVVDGILGIAKRKANRDLWADIERVCKILTLQHYHISVAHCNKEVLDTNSSNYQMNMLADSLAFRGANALIIC